MAGDKEARLNLVITATDDARAKVEEIVQGISESFRALRDEMTKAFEMPMMGQLTSPIPPELVDQVSGEAKAIADSFKQIGDAADSAAATTKAAFKGMAQSSRQSADETKVNNNTINKSFKFADALIGGQIIEGWGKTVVDALGGAALAAANFDQSVVNTAASLNSNLPSATQLSTTQIDKLRQTALAMGSDGYFSANQVADAMNVMAKQGLDYNTIMGGAMKTAEGVAAANQEDLTTTSNVISDIVHEMGTELISKYGNIGSAMQHVGDAMTGALHHARISMDDFLNTMKYVGPQASAAGVSMEDLSAAVAVLGEHGIRSSQAGTTLRRMLTNLTPASAAAKTEMQQLGMITSSGANIFYDAAGKMKPLADVQQILHDKLKSLSPEMQQMALKTIFGQYALSGMTAIANTTPSAFEAMVASMNKTGTVSGILAEKSKGMGFEIQQTKAHFDTFRKEIGEMLLPILQKLLQIVNSVMTWFEHLPKGVQKGIVIFAAMTGVLEIVAGWFMSLVGTLGMAAMGFAAFEIVAGGFGASFLPIIAVIGAAVAAVIGLYEAWKHNFLGIQDITNTVWNGIKSIIQAVWGFIGPYIMTALHTLQAYWNSVWPQIQQVLKFVWDLIKTVVMVTLDEISKYIKTVLDVLTPVWKVAWQAIQLILKVVWDTIVSVIKVAWDVIAGVFKVALDLLTGHWHQAWDDMKKYMENIWNDFKSFFVNIGKDMYDFGANMIKMFANGIMSAAHWVESAASSVINSVKGLLGFHSPTEKGPGSDADTWMPNMMNMFTKGITDNTPKIQAAIGNVALGLKTNMASTLTQVNHTNIAPVPNAYGQGQQMVVQINIDGRSAKTDNDLADMIAKKFRSQMTMVSA